jgi:hypothetical protein
MATDRKHLPQLDGDRIFLSDGGLETSLIYHGGFDLPAFAAFPLMRDGAGRDALRDYYRPYAEIAVDNRLGFFTRDADLARQYRLGREAGTPKPRSPTSIATVAMMQEIRKTLRRALADAGQRQYRAPRRRLPARPPDERQ